MVKHECDVAFYGSNLNLWHCWSKIYFVSNQTISAFR